MTSDDLPGGTKARELVELPAETKDGLLQWAQAHCVLLQVFGPREPLLKLMKHPSNKAHFASLQTLSAFASELQLPDEMYLSPLQDLPGLQRALHAESSMGKAVHEGLLIFAMGSKRKSRRARGK